MEIRSLLNDCKKIIDEYIIIISIFFGIMLYIPKVLVIFGVIVSENGLIINLIDLSTLIGQTILASGIFVAISKTIFFKKIFERVVCDVFYGENHLRRQSQEELEGIWHRVSSELYKHKFPGISAKIQDHILKTYFPSKHAYYYKNYRAVLIYKMSNKQGYVDIVEESHFLLTGMNESEPTNHKYRMCFNSDCEGDLENCSFAEVKLNGKQVLLNNAIVKLDETKKDDVEIKKESPVLEGNYYKLESGYCIYLDGKKKTYEFERRIKKSYPLITLNKINRTIFSKFVDGLSLTIIYPKDQLDVEFTKVGELGAFTSLCSKEEGIISQEYNEVIFPGQGYIINIDLKK